LLFNSYIFILLFLPLTVCGYFLINKKNTKIASAYLLGMSLWFYAYFNLAYLPLIVGSIAINFGLNKLMRHVDSKGKRKAIMLLGVLLNIGVLFYYKYYDFFAENVNAVFGADMTLLNLILPLGISFFTFQQVSYMVDSYHGEVPDYPILDYALFVTFFPQLIAGPIVLHSEVVPQFMDQSKRKFNSQNFARGMFAFALGLAKKVLLADVFGIAVGYAFGNVELLDSTNAIIGAVSYVFQMYFDFSGYSDMAIGLGWMFNIELPVNFNAPLTSRNCKEFWRRWHITLGRFFTRYIYFPLGGSRKGTLRTCINSLVVFAISGLWHGANWGYVIFGLNWGIMQVVNIFVEKWWKKIPGFLQWLGMYVAVVHNAVFAQAASVKDACTLIGKMYTFDFGPIAQEITDGFRPMEVELFLYDIVGKFVSMPAWAGLALYMIGGYVLVLGVKCAAQLVREFKPNWKNALVTIALTGLSILSFSGVSTFLYFNF